MHKQIDCTSNNPWERKVKWQEAVQLDSNFGTNCLWAQYLLQLWNKHDNLPYILTVLSDLVTPVRSD